MKALRNLDSNSMRAGCALVILALLPSTLPAEPSVPGYVVEEYADVDSPGRMSFDASGAMFVGNLDNSAGVTIHKVGPGGSPVEDFGQALRDPDAVLVDADGAISGTPGAVLVGGAYAPGAPGPEGYIVAMLPNQNTVPLFGSPTTVFQNPSTMRFDSGGRLLFTDPRTASQGFVFASSGETPAILYDYGGPYSALAIDSSDNIYTLSGTGTGIRIHDSTGLLIDDDFASHTAAITGMAFAPPGTAWAADLYAVAESTGELIRIDAQGNVDVIGAGFNAPIGIAFARHNGAMYISSLGDHKIYRIAKWIQWPIEQGGNGHYYMVAEAPEGVSWSKANEDALRFTRRSHLATIGSAEEDAFLARLLKDQLPEVGPVGAWVGGIQSAGAEAPDEGWRWTTDEPWLYTNWPTGEPNDLPYDEIYLEVFPRYPSYDALVWNDCCGGPPINEDRYLYVVEAPTLGEVEATVRARPYHWREVGEINVSTTDVTTIYVFSTATFDATQIDFDSVEIEGFEEDAKGWPWTIDVGKDGLVDYQVTWWLNRQPALPCGYQEHEFSAMTLDGTQVRGLLKFEAVGCTP